MNPPVRLPVIQPEPPAPTARKSGLRLTDMSVGQSCRILRIGRLDSSCRKRLAELGVAEGMRVTLAGNSGGQVMLQIGGAKMALGEGCASEIHVMRAT